MSEEIAESIEQIPARMINEFAYCPRLFFLEYVQGEWAHNADTLDGRFVHRRVDAERGRVPEPEKVVEMPRLHARSVLLGSDELGVTARVDVIEADDGRVIPVDYKRGAPPDVEEGAYEPERVQVCLQGLLLREHGYECVEGALYFAETNQRVRVELTDELVSRTRELIQQARKVAGDTLIPPPLVRSPKCPRCSLVGICLPDETNLLRGATDSVINNATDILVSDDDETLSETFGEVAVQAEPRRLIPARDDKLAVYVQGQGYSVGLRGEVLEIRERGKAVSEARLLETNQLCLFGNVQLSAQALHELAGRGVPVIHMSYGSWLTAVTTPPPHKNIDLRRRQFRAADDAGFCLQLARAFVSGKIRNARTLLRRNARELPRETLVRLAYARRDAERAVSLEQLLGIEGAAARDYFGKFSMMLKTSGRGEREEASLDEEDSATSSVSENGSVADITPLSGAISSINDSSSEAATLALDNGTWTRFDFTKRNRRPPRDPVNALLSFVYAMLAKDMVATLVGVGLDPYLGFYHQPRYGRPALALDLMEEFRPLVADSVVINLINNGEVRPTDFITRAGACALTPHGRKHVLDAYERRLDTLVTHPHFGYAISYRRIFEVQARLLARHLTGEINSYPAFCTR
ncbi:MAG: CRISPR-associated endonuclease Cas1 [Acidobacteriota bacterium]|nr:CRISPR-associated endonuclease Cas1 [Acidobacteriota bacterium]